MVDLNTFSLFITDVPNPQSVTREFLLFNIYIQLGGLFIISTFILYILNQWRKQPELRSSMNPIIYINLTLFLRIFVTLLNRIVLYYSDNTRTLLFLTVYQTIPWILIFIFSNILLKRIIRVTKQTEIGLNRIIRFNNISIILLFSATVVGLIGLDEITAGTIAAVVLLIVIIFLWSTTFVIKSEAEKNAAKLVKIRLLFFSYGVGFIAMSFTTTPFAIILSIIGLFTPSMAILNAIFNLLLVLGSGLFFYYSFYTPTWMKKRHGLFIEVNDLI
jgi:hypothetical protein